MPLPRFARNRSRNRRYPETTSSIRDCHRCHRPTRLFLHELLSFFPQDKIKIKFNRHTVFVFGHNRNSFIDCPPLFSKGESHLPFNHRLRTEPGNLGLGNFGLGNFYKHKITQTLNHTTSCPDNTSRDSSDKLFTERINYITIKSMPIRDIRQH